jgi:hypothetical protein
VLENLSDIKMDAIKIKQVTDISKRAAGPLETPGATPRRTGELRISARADYNNFEFGYSKEYAPHVEYGHRTRGGGGYVEGQKYLETNVNEQEPIYRQDVEDEISRILNGG